MCLAMPMKVVEIEGEEGLAELGGVRRKVSFQLLEQVDIGDFVLVHAGFAIARVDEEEARITLEAIEECGCDG